MSTGEILLEIAKIIISVLISTGILSIYLQVKIKRIGSYEKPTETVVGNTLIGIEEFFSKARTIDNIIEKIEQEIARDTPSVLLLRAYLNELKTKTTEALTAVDKHRMYLTPLLQLGATESYFFAIRCVEIVTEEILSELKARSTNIEEKGKLDSYLSRKKDAQADIQYAHEVYKSFCANIESVKRKVIRGKPIY